MKKLKPDPTPAEWNAEVAEIKRYRDLDRAPFRKALGGLARKLEEMGRGAHRDADRTEGLSTLSEDRYKDVDLVKYERGSVERQLNRWYKDQLHFIQPQLDRLIEPGNNGKPNLYYPYKIA